MKVCTAHDAHSSEVHTAEALLGIFFVSSFSAFLSEALLGLFCKHFFRISPSLSLKSLKLQKSAEMRKIESTEKKKNTNAEKSAKSPSLILDIKYQCKKIVQEEIHRKEAIYR